MSKKYLLRPFFYESTFISFPRICDRARAGQISTLKNERLSTKSGPKVILGIMQKLEIARIWILNDLKLHLFENFRHFGTKFWILYPSKANNSRIVFPRQRPKFTFDMAKTNFSDLILELNWQIILIES